MLKRQLKAFASLAKSLENISRGIVHEFIDRRSSDALVCIGKPAFRTGDLIVITHIFPRKIKHLTPTLRTLNLDFTHCALLSSNKTFGKTHLARNKKARIFLGISPFLRYRASDKYCQSDQSSCACPLWRANAPLCVADHIECVKQHRLVMGRVVTVNATHCALCGVDHDAKAHRCPKQLVTLDTVHLLPRPPHQSRYAVRT